MNPHFKKPYRYWLASLFAAVTLAGCAQPTYYQASGTDKRIWGYAEKQVDGALFRVSYIDMNRVGIERTYAYAMYRAAELAQSKGATHFEVIEGVINRPMLERFIARPLKTSSLYDVQDSVVVNAATNQIEVPPSAALPTRTVAYVAPTYIYVPVAPPPPPQSVTMLVRLLNAPSLDAAKGFDVQDLLSRLGPKVLRAPLKPV